MASVLEDNQSLLAWQQEKAQTFSHGSQILSLSTKQDKVAIILIQGENKMQTVSSTFPICLIKTTPIAQSVNPEGEHRKAQLLLFRLTNFTVDCVCEGKC